MKLLALLLITLMAFADTIINDPVFKPPHFTTATRPLCPTAYGCMGYNEDLKSFEMYDGTVWKAIGGGGITEWKTGEDYKVGALLNGGVDKNWILKVEQDHTSGDIDLDMNSGKLRPLSPPLITTGIQSGGAVSLAGTTVTINSGAGYISNYTGSVAPFPQIKSIEWATQTITVPATGIHSIFMDVNSLAFSVVGLGTSAQANNNISLGIADMNLGQIYRRGTYPTNPVGQLRALATFLGAMTKGLSYTGIGQQIARSSHQFYFWGTDVTDPYDPNTKVMPAVNPLPFYEFTRTGVIDKTIDTTLQTGVYDNAGTLVPLGNNKWGFARIYISLGVEDYIMYSQADYPGEAEAKAAAIAPGFVVPADIQLSKFASYVVYQKGDTDLSNNTFFTCEPFGCESGGGGGGGSGNVVGPSSAIDNDIVLFDGTTGKIIKDSGMPMANVVQGPAIAVNDNIAVYDGTTGKLIKDSALSKYEITKQPGNYLNNGDVEQGLVGYTGTAGIFTLNTTTPLEKLNSINFDGTALNDYVETSLVTIPPILMGQACMIRVYVRGGDANDQLQVVNGAGTIVGFKQLAVFTDSTPQFITFNCPTQALITATPALGQLKIKLVQSTATNAALATLDSFYLGQFESNQMVVSGEVEEYRATYGASVSAPNTTVLYPAPAKNTLDKCASYSGGIFTAKAKCSITFTCGADYAAMLSSGLYINYNYSGVSSMNQSTISAGTLTNRFSPSWSGVLNPGETLHCLNASTSSGSTSNTWVAFTATPLPQLATIVSTNQMRAGHWGRKVLRSCTFGTVTGTGAGAAFPLGTGCTISSEEGFVIASATNNLTHLGFTLSKTPYSSNGGGRLFFNFTNSRVTLTGDAQLFTWDVTNNIGFNGWLQSSGGESTFSIVSNGTIKTNVFYEIRCISASGTGTCNIGPAGGTAVFNLVWEPDLSDPYSIPELFAALPPQVINSSGKQWRTESCQIANPAGVATLNSTSCNTWVDSVSRAVAGSLSINLKPGIWSVAPDCICGIGNSAGANAAKFNGSSPIVVNCFSYGTTTGTGVDSSIVVQCQGQSQ